MTHFIESEDYSMCAFPALKTLEGDRLFVK